MTPTTMNDNKLVSAIITTYKRETSLLVEAIESVLAQTYSNIECIVVDDNGIGTDFQIKNEETICKYGNVLYLANVKNSGAQYSRNIGILNAKGYYIAFLDDDDLWETTKIEKQINLFSNVGNAECGLIFSNGYKFQNKEKNNMRLYKSKSSYESRYNSLISFNDITEYDYIGSTSQPLIKKECFAKVGLFDLSMPARQDYDMWLRIGRHYNMYGTDEPLFYHRIHEGEQISKNRHNAIIGMKNIYNKYKNDKACKAFSKASMLFRLSHEYLKNKNYLFCIFYMIKAAIVSPKCLKFKLKNNGVFKIKH